MKVTRGNHCAYKTHYHIVFPVKYRRGLLVEGITRTIQETARGIAERYEVEFESIGCDLDHIHLLVSLHPKYSPGQFVRLFKSITARQLFKQHPSLKNELWGGEFWTDGYYVATVGERGNWKVVENYIRTQGMKPEDMQLRLF